MDTDKPGPVLVMRRSRPPVTTEDLDRRLDALQETQTTIISVLSAIVQGQKMTRETVQLLGENLRAEFLAVLESARET